MWLRPPGGTRGNPQCTPTHASMDKRNKALIASMHAGLILPDEVRNRNCQATLVSVSAEGAAAGSEPSAFVTSI